MKRTEHVYTTAVAHACEICGVNHFEFHESRSEAAVDARTLVVGWMTGYGYTEAELQRLTGWSQQRINYLHNIAALRLHRRLFRERYAELANRMGELLQPRQTTHKQPTNAGLAPLRTKAHLCHTDDVVRN